MYDHSDAYIAVKETITVKGTNNVSKRNKNPSFKNNAPTRSCISKINNTFIDNAEDLDIVMMMHNLLEYNNHYSMTSVSLSNYCRDEVDHDANEIIANYKINNNKTTSRKYFNKYKIKITKRTPANNNRLNTEVVTPLKCLNNFWRCLNFPLTVK